MRDQRPNTVSDAEVLSVTTGVDDATGLPVVVLTLRPNAASGWGHVNHSLSVENARSLLDRLTEAFATRPYLPAGPSGTTA
jgi:hypothetical protein